MVFINHPTKNQTLNLHLPTTTTVAVHAATGVPPPHQRLYYSGASLNLAAGLISLPQTATLLLHLPLLGSMQATPPQPPPPTAPKPRLDFLHTKPPPNYVAGLGRGATGFTTRSDIGPARAARDLPDRSAAAAAAARKKMKERIRGTMRTRNSTSFEGNDVGLFASAEYDEDDKEADAVWESIDKRMDSRRKDRREAWLKEEIEKYRASNPKITEQFADLKRKLHTLSAQDWDNIPDIGDYSLRNKKKRFESFVQAPDTLLEKARQEKEHVAALDPKSRAAGGTETLLAQTPVTDLTAVGEGRGTVLSLKLDRLSDSVFGLTVVDPKGYLTDLKSMKITSDAEVSDIKKARLLLKSVTQTNPKHPPGWIAAARLEEVAGKIGWLGS